MMLCIVLVMSLFAGLEVSASADDVITHTAANGDYLFKVCKSYGLDYYQCKQAIMALNGFTSEQQLNKISVGQQIKLPASNAVAATVKASTVTTTTVATTTTIGGTTTTTTTTSAVSGALGGYNVAFYLVPHVVSSGETLNGICNGLGTSYTANSAMILGMNGISNANNIKAGKNVYIPTTKAPVSGNCYAVVEHTVSSGENLTSICSQYGVNYASNAQLVSGLNAGKDVSRIYAGQKLYIPVLTASTGVSVPSTSTVPGASASVPTQNGYNIKFTATNYGSPYATVNGAKATVAEAGKKVQIISNADEGYNICAVSVIRLDTNANVLVSENSFVMPSSGVSVSVTYSEALRITKAAASNGKFKLLVNGSEEGYANYGDVITMVPSPNDGFAVAKVTLKNSLDNTIQQTLYANANGEFKFNMPNYPVTVSVVFDSATYYKVIAKTTGTGTGKVSFTSNGSAMTKAAANSPVTINIVPADGSVVRSVLVNGKNIDEEGNYGLKKQSDTCYTFKMPASEVTVTVEFYKTVTYSISQVSNKGGSVKFNVYDSTTKKISYSVNRAKAGDTVIVYPTPDTNYVFFKDGTTITYASGTSKVNLGSYDTTWCGYVFTMPAADVTVSPTWTKNNVARYAISMPDTENGSYYVSVDDGTGKVVAGNTSAAGKPFTIVISPKAGFVVAKDKNNNDIVYVSYGGVDYLTNKVDDTHYTFTMPAQNVSVKVKFKQLYGFADITKTVSPADSYVSPGKINVYASDGTEITGSASNARAGNTISIKVTTYEGYSLKAVKVNGKLLDGLSGNYKYTITTDDVSTGANIEAFFFSTDYTVQHSTPDSSMGEYEIYIDGVNRGKSDVTDAHNGQEVQLKIKPASAAYKIKQVAVDGTDVTADIEYDGTYYTYSYKMKPANSVTRVEFEPITPPPATTYSVIPGTLTNVSSMTSSPTNPKQGDTVSLTVTPTDTSMTVFTFKLVDAYNNDITYSMSGHTFKMPDCDVTVDVEASAP